LPAHDYLDDIMQAVQGNAARDDEPTPNFWFDIEKFYFQQVESVVHLCTSIFGDFGFSIEDVQERFFARQ